MVAMVALADIVVVFRCLIVMMEMKHVFTKHLTHII